MSLDRKDSGVKTDSASVNSSALSLCPSIEIYDDQRDPVLSSFRNFWNDPLQNVIERFIQCGNSSDFITLKRRLEYSTFRGNQKISVSQIISALEANAKKLENPVGHKPLEDDLKCLRMSIFLALGTYFETIELTSDYKEMDWLDYSAKLLDKIRKITDTNQTAAKRKILQTESYLTFCFGLLKYYNLLIGNSTISSLPFGSINQTIRKAISYFENAHEINSDIGAYELATLYEMRLEVEEHTYTIDTHSLNRKLKAASYYEKAKNKNDVNALFYTDEVNLSASLGNPYALYQIAARLLKANKICLADQHKIIHYLCEFIQLSFQEHFPPRKIPIKSFGEVVDYLSWNFAKLNESLLLLANKIAQFHSLFISDSNKLALEGFLNSMAIYAEQNEAVNSSPASKALLFELTYLTIRTIRQNYSQARNLNKANPSYHDREKVQNSIRDIFVDYALKNPDAFFNLINKYDDNYSWWTKTRFGTLFTAEQFAHLKNLWLTHSRKITDDINSSIFGSSVHSVSELICHFLFAPGREITQPEKTQPKITSENVVDDTTNDAYGLAYDLLQSHYCELLR